MTLHHHPQCTSIQSNQNPTMPDDIKAPSTATYSKAEPGTIHPERYCGNCTHLRSDVDPDEHPEGMCRRYGWGLLDENIARCTGHHPG